MFISSELLHFIALVALLVFAMLLCIANSPVESVIYLISVFLCAGISLFLFSLDFLGLSFVIVYIGAIAILLVFVIMMLEIKSYETSFLPETGFKKNFYNIRSPFFFVLIIVLVGLVPLVVEDFAINMYSLDDFEIYGLIDELSNLDSIGQSLFNFHYIYVLFAGLLLLLPLIGAIILTSSGFLNNFSLFLSNAQSITMPNRLFSNSKKSTKSTKNKKSKKDKKINAISDSVELSKNDFLKEKEEIQNNLINNVKIEEVDQSEQVILQENASDIINETSLFLKKMFFFFKILFFLVLNMLLAGFIVFLFLRTSFDYSWLSQYCNFKGYWTEPILKAHLEYMVSQGQPFGQCLDFLLRISGESAPAVQQIKDIAVEQTDILAEMKHAAKEITNTAKVAKEASEGITSTFITGYIVLMGISIVIVGAMSGK